MGKVHFFPSRNKHLKNEPYQRKNSFFHVFLIHAAVLAVLIPMSGAWAQTVLLPGADIATSLNAGNYNLALGGNATWNSFFFINGPANANISIDGRGNTINVGLANQIIWAVYDNSVALKNATVTTTAPITANRPTLFYHDTVNVTSSLALENTTFTGFNHEGLGGSILYAYAIGATLNVDGGTQGVTFYRNRGVGDAGGAAAVYFGSLNFNGKVTFDSNWTGSYGGAIAVYQARNFLTFNGETTFKNNHATVFGGAIDLWGGASTVNFNGPKTTFDGNYVYYTSALTEDNPLHVNDQHARGGAINIGYLSPGGTDSATINFNKPVDFKNNYVVSTGNLTVNRNALGGAISLYDNGPGYLYRITFNDSALFQGNYAYALDALGVGNGGAIYYNAGSAQLTLSSGTQFLDNYAKTLGGAIYLQAGTINLNAASGDILFQGNRQGASFDASYKPIAASGTPNAIYMDNSSTLNLNASAGRTINFYDPIASATGAGITLTVNKSGAGEVLFHGDNGATSLYNSVIRANTNVNGGIFTLADGVAYGKIGEGNFSVKTTGTVRGSNGAQLLAQTVAIDSGGTLGVNGGLFTINAASPITLATGAAISGEGTLAATQNLVFNGTGVVTATVDAAKTLNITPLITGSGGLTKAGAGTLVLSASNTYTGATAINGGTLQAGTTNVFANSSAVTMASGTFFDLNNQNQTVHNLAGSGTITLGSAALSINSLSNTAFNGTISGSGNLIKTGTGTFSLGGASVYSGGTTIFTDRLIATNASALGTGAVNNSGILELNFTGSMGNQLSGIVEKTGAGIATLTGTTSSVSTMDVMAGTLALNQSNSPFTTTGNYTTRSNAITTIGSSSNLAVGGIFTQEANAALNVSIGTNNPIITADSASLNGALTVSGYIASVPTTASALSAAQQTILQTINGISNNFSSVNFDNVTNTPDYLTFSGFKSADQKSYAVGLGLSWQAGAAKGHGTFTLANALDTFDVDVMLSNQTGPFISGWNGTSLTKNGSGTLILSQANTYTGTTAINGGTLQAGAVDIFANSSAVSVGTGATFALNNYNQAVHNLSGTGFVTLGSAILTANNTANSTFGGIISDTGGLTKTGTGTLTLSGANAYTGTTTINSGTLQAGATNIFTGSSNVTVGTGSTLNLNNYNQTVHNLTGSGSVTLGSATLTANNTANSTFGGIISDTGGLTKTGTGTLTLSGANAYTGATTINSGTLQAGVANIFANSSTVTINSGSTFALNNYNQSVHNLAGSGSVTLGSATLNANNTANSIFGGTISGTGSLIKTGTSTLTLGGENTYTGETSINSGILSAGIANIFADSSSVTVGSGTTFALNNYNQSVHNLAGSGSVTLGSATLIANNTANSTFGGIISGTGNLTKTGTGTLTLGNANTYTGITDINSGILSAGIANIFAGSGSVIVGSGTTFALNNYNQSIHNLAGTGFVTLGSAMLTANNTANSTYGGIISGTGSLTKSGAGTLTLAGVNTYTGATAINSGTIEAGTTNIFADSASVAVNSGATLALNDYNQTVHNLSGNGTIALGSMVLSTENSGNTTFGGIISGTGNLTKTGTGVLTLSGIDTYSGGTAIFQGRLIAANASALGTGTVSNSGILELDFTGSMGNQLSGVIEKTGTGIATLTGTTSSTTSVEVKAGTLNLVQNGTFATDTYTTRNSATTILGNVSTLNVNGTFTQEIGSTLSVAVGANSPVITAESASLNGTLVVSGINTSVPLTASALPGQQFQVLETTTGTIAGNFSGLNFGAAASPANYLTLTGWKSDDQKRYAVGLGLAWLAGSDKGNGTFTLANLSDTFDVDVVLANRTGPFVSGWNGTSLTKNGSGTLILSQANTYTGTTTISVGTLQAGAVDIFANSSAVSIGTGATFALNNYNQAVHNLAGTGFVTLGSATLNASNTANSTFGGIISGTGNLAKTGTGALTLSGANTYSGTTAINSGTLGAGAANIFANSSSVNVGSGATFALNNYNQSVHNLAGSGSVTLGSATLTANNIVNSTFGGIISGTGGFTKSGTGSLTLGSTNTYTGATTINGGMIEAGTADIFANSSVLTINSGSTFALNNYNQSIRNLTGTGTVTLGSAILTANNTASSAFGGAISGTGDLTKTGTGTLTLSSATSSVGEVDVKAGTLSLTQNGTFTTDSHTTRSGATTTLGNSSTLSINGAFTQESGSALSVVIGANNPAITAQSASLNGTLVVSGVNTSTTLTASALPGQRFQVLETNTGTIAGDFTSFNFGAASSPANYLTLTGWKSDDQKSYAVGLGLAWLAGSDKGNGTFTLANLSDTFNVDIALADRTGPFASGWNGTSLTKNGSGTLILSVANTYSGTTTISGGALVATNQSALGTGNVVNNGTLELNFAGTMGNQLTGSGTIEKTGTGIVTLTNAASSAGVVNVKAGTLNLSQNGTFTTNAYTTRTGATTTLNTNSKLHVNGAFIQEAGSALSIGIGSNNLAITADTALLNGSLAVSGVDASLPATASALNNQQFTVLETTSGISGDFTAFNFGSATSATDYLTLSGWKSEDEKSYAVGLGLSWLARPDKGNGTFTLTNAADTFEVDIALEDRTDSFISGWNGTSLTKNGNGSLTLSAANTYSGGTIINGGTLVAAHESALGTGNVVNNGTLELKRNTDSTLSNALSGTGALEKTGTGALTLTAAGSSAGAVTVKSGKLIFDQTDAFSSASHTTESSAVTSIGPSATLNVAGSFVQQSGSTLNMALGSNIIGNSITISADSGALAGNLYITGFDASELPASVLVAKQHTILQTNNTLSGNFNNIDFGGTSTGVDYLTLTGSRTDSDTDYQVGFGLKWLETNGDGSFSMLDAAQTFDVDIQLTDQTWGLNGSDLIKSGEGTLILSAGKNDPSQQNTYTGKTLAGGGVISLRADTALGLTSELNIADTASVTLNGTSQQVGKLITQNGSRLDFGGGTMTITDTQRQSGDTAGGSIEADTLFGDGKLIVDPSILTINGANTGYVGDLEITGGSQVIMNNVAGVGNIGNILVDGTTDTLTFDMLSGSVASGELKKILSGQGIVQTRSSGTDITLAADNSAFSGQFDVGTDTTLHANQTADLGRASVILDGTLVATATSDWTMGNAVTGNGLFLKDGSASLIITDALSTFTGQTSVAAGTLIAGTAPSTNVRIGGSVDIATAATLSGTGSINGTVVNNGTIAALNATPGYQGTTPSALTTGALTNAGTIRLAGASIGNTLTVRGGMTGNNGTLEINTVMERDASPTDKLILDGGATSGNTSLLVHNEGGAGAQTQKGILVIDAVNGATTTTDAFSLSSASSGYRAGSGTMVVGAYDYNLIRGGVGGNANSWYLSSTLTARPETGVYLVNREGSESMFALTLRDRLINYETLTDPVTGEQYAGAAWGRIDAKRRTSYTDDSQLRTTSNTATLQSGLDLFGWSDEVYGSFRGGFMFGMGTATSDTESRGIPGPTANGDLTGYSVGVYGTWFQNEKRRDGLYIDTWLQHSWFDNQLKGTGLAGESYKARMWSASVESGYTFPLKESAEGSESSTFFTPSLQLIRLSYSADDFTEKTGTYIRQSGGDKWMTRLGGRLHGRFMTEGKTPVEPFVEANWWHSTKTHQVNFDTHTVRSDLPKDIGEIKIGLESKPAKNLSFSLSLSGQAAEKNYRQIGAQFGIRYSW